MESNRGIWVVELADEGSNSQPSSPVSSTKSPAKSENIRREEEKEEEEAYLTGKHHRPRNDSFNDMSSLQQQLPSRRGLSKHYKGRSQSFTSLSDVKALEDLAKPENPFNTKLRQRRENLHDGRVFPETKASCSSAFSSGRGDRNLGQHEDLFMGNNNSNRAGAAAPLPRHHPPLRATTLTAAHLAALLTRT